MQGWLQRGVKRQFPVWWSGLLHLNMSPPKARSPTFIYLFIFLGVPLLDFNSFVYFPLFKCKHLVIDGELRGFFLPIEFPVENHTLPGKSCRRRIWVRQMKREQFPIFSEPVKGHQCPEGAQKAEEKARRRSHSQTLTCSLEQNVANCGWGQDEGKYVQWMKFSSTHEANLQYV